MSKDHGGAIQWPEGLDAPRETNERWFVVNAGEKMEEMGMKPIKHQCDYISIYNYVYIYICIYIYVYI